MSSLQFMNFSKDPIDTKFLEHLKILMNEQGVELHIEMASAGQTWAELQRRLKGFRAVLIDVNQSPELVRQIPILPTEVRSLYCADGIFLEDGQWWPRLDLKDAIHELIVKKGKNLDIKETAFIIGEGVFLRLLGALAASFGFARVTMVGLSEEDVQQQIRFLQQAFVGIDWRMMEASQLTMQTSTATLLMNALSIKSHEHIVNDLAYFNFMKPQGLFVDLNMWPFENLLLEEAGRASLRSISGIEVRTQRNYHFLRRLGLSQLITFEDYAARWRQYVLDAPPHS